MAFSGTHMVITLRYILLGQQCQTARPYSWDGAAIAAATAAEVAEAWWNHYKTAWRDLAISDADNIQFVSVHVREVGGSLSAGEYSIPVDERDGLRVSAGLGSLAPSYQAVGTRLTVGTSVTRPGQMRIPFLMDGDTDGNVVAPAFLELASELADLYSQGNILGAPVATGAIFPAVVTFGEDPNTITAFQDIIGFVLNGFVTSQVSRRYGHGS